MKTNILATAIALTDRDLLARIDVLAGQERAATVELVAHLAALEARPSLYAAQGYGSLFAYCTERLRLSEDAAWNRIAAARTCRDFPVVLDLLAVGSLTLTAVRMLRPHITPENQEAVLARAANGNKERIEALVAELAPRPDVMSLVRKLPVRPPIGPSTAPTSAPMTPLPLEIAAPTDTPAGRTNHEEGVAAPTRPPALRPGPRPVVQALAPERYRVQFTIGQEGYGKLRRLQTLLRREIPNGDPGVIFEKFLDVLLAKVERAKLGKRAAPPTYDDRIRAKPGKQAAPLTYENRIRSGTDKTGGRTTVESAGRSRRLPNAVKRAVWFRDRGQCAFVARTGHRCTERNFLELHHIQPYALNGPPTVRNISLRCRRHNRYEAELIFGSPPG